MLWILLASLFISFTPRVLTYIQPDDHSISESEFERLKLEHSESVGDQSDYKVNSNKRIYRHQYNTPPCKFDPNTYKLSDWMKLGLSQKQADIIMKFSSNRIDNNDELQNIFVISDELFDLIKDSTFYPTKAVRDNEKVDEITFLDLNSATADELDKLPGIGKYYAKKIIDYRESLGGYLNKEQLLEIWNFDPQTYERIKGRVNTQSSVNRLNINTATVEELNLHPYIDYKQANSIVKMREQHGAYVKVEEIKRSKLIDDNTYQRIKNYLKVE